MKTIIMMTAMLFATSSMAATEISPLPMSKPILSMNYSTDAQTKPWLRDCPRPNIWTGVCGEIDGGAQGVGDNSNEGAGESDNGGGEPGGGCY